MDLAKSVLYSSLVTTAVSTDSTKDLGEWAFAIGDRKSSLVAYGGVRRGLRATLLPFLRVEVIGRENLSLDGPTILAPVHRSHLDSVIVGALTNRRIRALAKEALFQTPGLARGCAMLGAIPVRRGEADLAAMKAAKKLLDRGECMVVFPEGTRQQGDQLGELFDGVAWLAARTGALVIPIGIKGTEDAMSEGSTRIRRSNVGVVAGDPMQAPSGPNGKRANRAQMAEFTNALRARLQQAQNEAVVLVASR